MRGANGESISIESARFDRVECDWNTLLAFGSGSMDVPRGKTQRTPSRFRGDDRPPPPPALLEVSAVCLVTCYCEGVKTVFYTKVSCIGYL